jgi:hypothetical protein
MDAVIVDIAKPPGRSKLTLFNIYVTLSRSSGRDTIRILQDYDEKALMQPWNHELVIESTRLEKEDAETISWWHKLAESGGWKERSA